MLQNRKYVGDWTWNKTRSLTSRQTGKRRYEVRPKEEWVGAPYPHLAQIPQETWDLVVLRFGDNRRSGKPSRRGIQNHYLLSGLLTCHECGGLYHPARDIPTAAQARHSDTSCSATRYPTSSRRPDGLKAFFQSRPFSL